MRLPGRQRKGSVMIGQISITEYIHDRDTINIMVGHCGNCVCRSCLFWWSGRCPHGGCYDDLRAQTDPYDAAHPDKPPRDLWSTWDQPGEQAHWCRGGVFYPTHYCQNFQKYQGQQVKDCLEAVVSVFQDGYIDCSLVDSVGCAECYRRFGERMEWK